MGAYNLLQLKAWMTNVQWLAATADSTDVFFSGGTYSSYKSERQYLAFEVTFNA